jgi:hypothetical protein
MVITNLFEPIAKNEFSFHEHIKVFVQSSFKPELDGMLVVPDDHIHWISDHVKISGLWEVAGTGQCPEGCMGLEDSWPIFEVVQAIDCLERFDPRTYLHNIIEAEISLGLELILF